MMDDFFADVYITPAQLITALQECATKWPNARLHKNDVTRNLTVEVDGEYIGMVDLLDATVVDFRGRGLHTDFIAGATNANPEEEEQ